MAPDSGIPRRRESDAYLHGRAADKISRLLVRVPASLKHALEDWRLWAFVAAAGALFNLAWWLIR